MKLVTLTSLALALAAPAVAHADAVTRVQALGDHYACYTAKLPVSLDMTLVDQFGSFKFHADTLSRLCNPVNKTYRDKTTKVKNPDLHYVCYTGKAKPVVTHTVEVTNQFGVTTVDVKGPNEVCAPSTKKVIK